MQDGTTPWGVISPRVPADLSKLSTMAEIPVTAASTRAAGEQSPQQPRRMSLVRYSKDLVASRTRPRSGRRSRCSSARSGVTQDPDSLLLVGQVDVAAAVDEYVFGLHDGAGWDWAEPLGGVERDEVAHLLG